MKVRSSIRCTVWRLLLRAGVIALLCWALVAIASPAADAGTVWVTDGVMHSGGSGSCDAFQARGDFTVFAVTNGCPSGGLTIAGGFPDLLVLGGHNAFWITTAPPGITITSAWTQNGDVYGFSSRGFVIGDFWKDNSTGSYGGSRLASGQRWFNTGVEGTPNINSSIYGMQVVCTSSTPCDGSAILDVTGIELAGVENQGPSLTALGGDNLWYQGGHWIWNPPGDPWSIALQSSDPSGVCNMWAVVNNQRIQGPWATPNSEVWHQCPDQAWTSGASVDTRGYVGGSGTLALTLAASNAAGVVSAPSETVAVDNDPVGLSLSTPNDPNPTLWVDHAVTIKAAASAGPSGVGGINCSVDRGAVHGYTSAGVTVDGDGTHTVTCTAWNQAIGPQGQRNTGTSSMPVKIDEAPPSVAFEPQNPADPTQLVVDTADSESGVGGGAVALAPSGTGSWTALPTSSDGQHLLARLDDAGLHGAYTIQATSCDNVGNCASTAENLTLPLRLAAASDVSFRKIEIPARVVRKRVLVGFHYKRVRRHGKLVRVKRGGHYRTIRLVIHVNTRCAHRRVKTGRRRWREITVCRKMRLHLVRSRRVAYGKRVTLHGLLMTGQGVPISGAQVAILTAPAGPAGRNRPWRAIRGFREQTAVTTGADGRWALKLPAGPSRIVEAAYGGAATILPDDGQASVIVPASVRIHISPTIVPWGSRIRITGRVRGGYVPPSSNVLRLLFGNGPKPHTIGTPDIQPNGRFSIPVTWSSGVGVVRYWFAVGTLSRAHIHLPGVSPNASASAWAYRPRPPRRRAPIIVIESTVIESGGDDRSPPR
jgi:hypothetical protein